MQYLPLKYKIYDKVFASLEAEKVAPLTIRNAKRALKNSVRTFDRYLKRLKNGNHAWVIRQAAIVVDNTLINKWAQEVKEADEKGDDRFETFLIPGFARVRFSFPDDVQYPCLPVRDPHFGLIYVQKGETYATAAEILLALQAGATVEALTSVEFSVVSKYGRPECPFMPYLKGLISERKRYKAEDSVSSKIMEKALKESVNSTYGKTAQGVNPRKVVQAHDGDTEILGPSKITESIMASLTTGLARAALSAVLLAIERFNQGKTEKDQISIVSATTDGLLIGLPAPSKYTVVGDYYSSPSHEEMAAGATPEFIEKPEPKIADVLTRFGCGELLVLLEDYLPLRQMRHSRRVLTDDDTYLEIKHFADEVSGYKTRGQKARLSTQHCSFMAKFGQRPPFSDIISDPEERKNVMATGGIAKNTIEAKWIEEYASLGDGKVREYNFYTLNSFTEIQNGLALDLTQKVTTRKFNSDFDCKRKFKKVIYKDGSTQISPVTIPFETHAQMKKTRAVSQAIRKAGYMATPERILEQIDLQVKATRARGGTPVTLARLMLRGVLQGHIPMNQAIADYAALAQSLNDAWIELGLDNTAPKVWSISDLKNAKRGLWEPGFIHETLPLVDLLERLCVIFGADLETVKALVFVSDSSLDESVGLIEDVAKAVVLAPRQGIAPFSTLYIEGSLPTRQRVLDAFHPHLTESRLSQLIKTSFVPEQRASSDRPRIRRLLARLGINGVLAATCARVLAPVKERKVRDRKMPKNSKCTEMFVQALFQPDIVSFHIDKARLLHHFAEYDLTREIYGSLRQRKFTARVLSNSSTNRRQIRQMAKRLGIDPHPFFNALLNQ